MLKLFKLIIFTLYLCFSSAWAQNNICDIFLVQQEKDACNNIMNDDGGIGLINARTNFYLNHLYLLPPLPQTTASTAVETTPKPMKTYVGGMVKTVPMQTVPIVETTPSPQQNQHRNIFQ